MAAPKNPKHSPASRPKKTRLRDRRGFLIALIVVSALGLIGMLTGFGVLLWAAKDLPTLRSLADYQPPQSTVIFDQHGTVIARLATERRTVVPYSQIPKSVVQAVTASEDADFFEHAGLDYVGMARCAVKSLLAGRTKCGASTITQQTVKTFLLTPERTLKRKLREAVLAKRIEEALTKEDILFLYLNQIYFGHGAYGIEEAAKVYFGIQAKDLSVVQSALLAGLPQSPSRLDPYRHPRRALQRRSYVLKQMRKVGHIDEASYQAMLHAPLKLAWKQKEELEDDSAYVEQVRKILFAQVGEDTAMTGGLRVYTGMDASWQRAAESAVREGLKALDKRQGWRGPILHLEANAQKKIEAELKTDLASHADPEDPKAPTMIWDLSQLGSEATVIEELAEQARFVEFKLGESYAGIVSAVSDSQKEAVVDLGGVDIKLPFKEGLSWAHPVNLLRRSRRPSRPSEVLKVGDVVWVQSLPAEAEAKAKEPKTPQNGEKPVFLGMLDQKPKVEAALLSIDLSSREVRAMVGGYGSGAGTFNRAIQARRQAGSTFKPFVYGAAFSTKEYTPISHCMDAPRVYRDPWTGRSWKPENYGHRYDGEITLRRALTASKNVCTVELVDKIGVDAVHYFAKQAGIKSQLPRNLTVGLGSGDVSLLEMVNAYATLASEGRLADAIFVRKITGPDGSVLFETKSEFKKTIPSEVAYLTTSLMQSVVEDGSGRRVRALKRPVAGKTGTTNESRDAWFIGFTPELASGVWVGFDNNDPLGWGETGGRAAIPIWMDFMRVATDGVPVTDFVAPAGIVFTRVDPKSGKLAAPDYPDSLDEPFILGTEPTEFAETAPPPDQLLWEDYR